MNSSKGVLHLSNDIVRKCPTQRVNQSNRVNGKEVRQADSITYSAISAQDNNSFQTLEDFNDFYEQNATRSSFQEDFALYEKISSDPPPNSDESVDLDSSDSGFSVPPAPLNNESTSAINGWNSVDNPATKPVHPKTSPNFKVIVIEQQYLGESVKDASDKHRVLCVKSDMGTGKTSAMRTIIADLPEDAKVLFISSRKKLLRALAKSLALDYYEDLVTTDKDRAKNMAERLAITPQSLHKILNAAVAYDYIVIDESESVAAMLVSTATKEKEKVVAALKTISSSSKHIIAMDAFLGERTETLLSIMTGEKNAGHLINTYKRWEAITAHVLDGGKYSDRVNSSDSLQIKAINQGHRIAISTNSKGYADTRYEVLKSLYPELKIGLITSDETPESRRLMDYPDTANEYDILIFSPAVSIGVSFDVENHFQTVFGIYSNVDKTGDSDDAVQGMARIRNPGMCQWVIVLDDNKQVYNNEKSMFTPDDIKQAIDNRFKREMFFSGSSTPLSIESDQIIDMYSVCQNYRVKDKNNFNARFLEKLIGMGVKLVKLANDNVEQNLDSEAMTQDAKASRKEQANKDKIESPKIDGQQYGRLKFVQKVRPQDMTVEQLASMERFRFERRFDIDCDQLTTSEKEKFLALDDDGVIGKCINREIAMSDNGFTKKYVKARIEGVDGGDSFKVDVLDEKLNYRLKKKLIDYAVPYFNGDEYNHASLKNGAMVKFIERNQKEIIIANVMPLPKGWKKKPALVMNYLLDICGYKHTHSRRRVSGKVQRIYSAIPDSHVDDICQTRQESGKDWITQNLKIMGIYQKPMPRLERLWNEAVELGKEQEFLSMKSSSGSPDDSRTNYDDIQELVSMGIYSEWMGQIINFSEVA